MNRPCTILLAFSTACTGAGDSGVPAVDACTSAGALSDCLAPTQSMAYYAEKSSARL